MQALGSGLTSPTRIYLVGGGTAVLHGWRPSTIDVDLVAVPERDELFRTIVRLKDELSVNVELASPAHFIPELPGWEERSPFIAQHGAASFHHYDPYAQALAKLERGHRQDLEDVAAMARQSLIEPHRLRELFEAIEPRLERYPAVDPTTFRAAVLQFVAETES